MDEFFETYDERIANEEGRKEAAAYIINNLIDEGVTMELIEKVTELKENEIKDLLKEQDRKRRRAIRINLIQEFSGVSLEEAIEIDYKKSLQKSASMMLRKN